MECTLDRVQAAQLYGEHGRAVRAYLAARLRDPAVVEDLCQETFAVALERGVPAEAPGRWLFGIARNKARAYLRDARPVAPATDDPPAANPAPLERLQEQERVARVRAAVEALEEPLREVIRLRYEGGLDYRGIAQHLEVPVSTVQGRLKRARWALARALGGGQA